MVCTALRKSSRDLTWPHWVTSACVFLQIESVFKLILFRLLHVANKNANDDRAYRSVALPAEHHCGWPLTSNTLHSLPNCLYGLVFYHDEQLKTLNLFTQCDFSCWLTIWSLEWLLNATACLAISKLFSVCDFCHGLSEFCTKNRTSMKSLLTLDLLAYHWRVHVILYYVYCIFV